MVIIFISIVLYRNHSLDVHYKREPGGIHHQLHPADKKDINKRKPTLNLFQRFRTSKQDKIAANVQQHIRAVRAAEALDRQTRVRRTNCKQIQFHSLVNFVNSFKLSLKHKC